jgi:hypothetical protein
MPIQTPLVLRWQQCSGMGGNDHSGMGGNNHSGTGGNNRPEYAPIEKTGTQGQQRQQRQETRLEMKALRSALIRGRHSTSSGLSSTGNGLDGGVWPRVKAQKRLAMVASHNNGCEGVRQASDRLALKTSK